jgi:hypothetical protein
MAFAQQEVPDYKRVEVTALKDRDRVDRTADNGFPSQGERRVQ